MQVWEIMNEVKLVSPATSVVEASRHMRDLDVGALPVTADGQLIGMVTDRDIVARGVASGELTAATIVSEVMTPEVFCCEDTDDLETAAELMSSKQVRRLAVLDQDRRLIGIISLGDIARCDDDAGVWALSDVCAPTPKISMGRANGERPGQTP